MRRLALTLLVATLFSGLPAVSQTPKLSLDCSIGPVPKTFGGTPWLVYACSDGKSIVVVADEGNPGSPFYFMLFPKNGVRQLAGEGTGKKSVTEAAHKELASLSEQDIDRFIAAAKQREAK